MKYVAWIVCVVAGPALAWGASTDEFKFVSTLSAPVASFGEVETKSCVVTQPGGEFNVGNAESSGGTINIQGGPIKVDKLYMEGNTTLGSSGNINWLVKDLYVGKLTSADYTVQVNELIARLVELNNASTATDTTLNASTLQVDSTTHATAVEARNLSVNKCSDVDENDCFRFVYNDATNATPITWGQIAKQEYGPTGAKQTENPPDDVTRYYPISTEFPRP